MRAGSWLFSLWVCVSEATSIWTSALMSSESWLGLTVVKNLPMTPPASCFGLELVDFTWLFLTFDVTSLSCEGAATPTAALALGAAVAWWWWWWDEAPVWPSAAASGLTGGSRSGRLIGEPHGELGDGEGLGPGAELGDGEGLGPGAGGGWLVISGARSLERSMKAKLCPPWLTRIMPDWPCCRAVGNGRVSTWAGVVVDSVHEPERAVAATTLVVWHVSILPCSVNVNAVWLVTPLCVEGSFVACLWTADGAERLSGHAVARSTATASALLWLLTGVFECLDADSAWLFWVWILSLSSLCFCRRPSRSFWREAKDVRLSLSLPCWKESGANLHQKENQGYCRQQYKQGIWCLSVVSPAK